jgi:hypothetical protein
MRSIVATYLALCVTAGCAAAQQPAAPPAAPPTAPQPAPAATTPPTPQAAGELSAASSIDDVLDALDQRGDTLEDFTANVALATADTSVGNEEKLTGKLWMQRLAGGDDSRVRVLFDRKQVNENPPKADRQEIMLSQGKLTERNYIDRREVQRQILKPGQKMNLLKLGEGPFPLPLGQDKADVHRMFEVQKIAAAKDDPAGAIHVQLKPKPGTQFETKFATIDFWVNPASRMPVKIVTEDPNQTTMRTTELNDVKINAKLTDKDFALDPVDESQWNIQQVPYED